MHEWISNVCWKCWTVTKEKKDRIQWAHRVSLKKNALDIRPVKQKQSPSTKCKLVGQRSLRPPNCNPPPSCVPFLFCWEYRGSVKSIPEGAIVRREATVKLEWFRPGSGLFFIAEGTGEKPQLVGVLDLGWATNPSLILPGVCLWKCYHNKASSSVSLLAFWGRLRFNRPWWCVLCQRATQVSTIPILCSSPPHCPFSCPSKCRTERQRGTNQHTHPQLHSINSPLGQSCCLCNMLTMLRVGSEKEKRQNKRIKK